MPRRKLTNYLRTYRKRMGLSQEELAFLLGCQSGTKVSRYECFVRQPTLKTALAYEAIFGIPLRELFAGIFEEIEQEIVQRAEILAQRLQKGKPDRATARKLEFLRMVVIAPEIIAENENI